MRTRPSRNSIAAVWASCHAAQPEASPSATAVVVLGVVAAFVRGQPELASSSTKRVMVIDRMRHSNVGRWWTDLLALTPTGELIVASRDGDPQGQL